MRTLLVVVGAALVAVLLVGACGGSSGGGSGLSDAGTIAAGEDLYQRSCASCHGADLRGTERGPSHLSIVYEPSHHGDDAFRAAIAGGAPQHHWGFGDMASVGGLTEDEVDSIIAFVRDVQRREGFEAYPPE